MKQVTLWIACLLLACSCEEGLPLYDAPDCWLNFEYRNNSGAIVRDSILITPAMRESAYSFVYSGDDVTLDTVWVKVTTAGFLSDRDRPLALAQIPPLPGDTTAVAVAGEHYVPFDDPAMAPYYMIPAGAVEANIPILVKRAPSLAAGDVRLRFTFKENAHFKPGYAHMIERSLLVSNSLSKPNNWDGTRVLTVFGVYGPVKHKFLIDASGEAWDEAYITALVAMNTNYVNYLAAVYRLKLAELNAERAGQGLSPLGEADGNPVVI
ncbi:MAG: DUF4843 domain-containing protein [Odoribacteraceae bacterium]|jgi:hypothetical protein|nr:DUF4843 domain-containing protein [Odoribacteraceae bacterium]